ncbi:MAG TPA: hypothetical protein VGF55_23665 [Gemmataceae bacterium]|jgi:hypothetical protein
MVRLAVCLACLLAVPALAPAQGIVVAGYTPPVVTAYYTPPPVVTSSVVTSYYAAQAVSYYATPAVSYYTTPGVVTYRYPLLRPRATVVRYWPGATVAAPVVASYYAR